MKGTTGPSKVKEVRMTGKLTSESARFKLQTLNRYRQLSLGSFCDMLIPGPQRQGTPKTHATPETSLNKVNILSPPNYVGKLTEL